MNKIKITGLGNFLLGIIGTVLSIVAYNKALKTETGKAKIGYRILSGVSAVVAVCNYKETADKMLLPEEDEIDEEEIFEDEEEFEEDDLD